VAACVSLSHRATRGWGWGPAGMLSIIGLLVGISFLFSGFDLLGFSSRFHSRID
jgi:uncharacterized membrane protein HdeD (DUF308 family)